MATPRQADELPVVVAMLDATEHPIAYLDRSFGFVRVNRAYAEACRRPTASFVGENHFALYPDAENQAIFERVRATGEAAVLRARPFVFPDQPERGCTYWDWSLVPVPDADGEAGGFVLSLRDVTDQEQARQRAADSEALALHRAAELEAVLDAVPAAIFFARDPSCTNVDGNAYAVRLLQVEGRSNLSKSAPAAEQPPYRPLRDGVEVPEAELPMQRAARLGVEVRDEEYELELEDGTRRFILGGATPVRIGAAVQGAVGAFVDITARKAAERALAESDRRKDDFLGMLSHELRNPLAPIRNAVHILRLAEPGGEPSRRARAVIERQVDHLSRLVDDLLDVTRIARGKVELRRETIDLFAVVRRAADDHRSVFGQREVALTVRLPREPGWVDGDAARLTQVAGNLLANAAKFTEPGGHVAVTGGVRDGAVTLRVADTGVGMGPELLERVFDPFVQADGSLARTQGGLGLGLALVRGLVELHGGGVRAESDGPGRGSAFVLELPRASAPDRTEPAAGRSAVPVRRRRVLVVDDNLDAAESLAMLIGLLGHDVEVAHDGPAALERVRARRPDLVLCDVGLPVMSGYDLAQALRAEVPGLRLVAVSGYARPEDLARAVQAGFDAHIAKPPDPQAIEQLLG